MQDSGRTFPYNIRRKPGIPEWRQHRITVWAPFKNRLEGSGIDPAAEKQKVHRRRAGVSGRWVDYPEKLPFSLAFLQQQYRCGLLNTKYLKKTEKDEMSNITVRMQERKTVEVFRSRFTLIEFLMRKSCKSGGSFRRQQGRAGRCQSPDPASSFILQLLNCFNVQLFQCFSTSSFRVPCSIFLLRRGKTKVFTLIELLIVIAIITILQNGLVSWFNFTSSLYSMS